MAEKLPSAPYKAEWKALGEGNDIRKYLKLTVIEQFVPFVFVLMYIAVAMVIL